MTKNAPGVTLLAVCFSNVYAYAVDLRQQAELCSIRMTASEGHTSEWLAYPHVCSRDSRSPGKVHYYAIEKVEKRARGWLMKASLVELSSRTLPRPRAYLSAKPASQYRYKPGAPGQHHACLL